MSRPAVPSGRKRSQTEKTAEFRFDFEDPRNDETSEDQPDTTMETPMLGASDQAGQTGSNTLPDHHQLSLHNPSNPSASGEEKRPSSRAFMDGIEKSKSDAARSLELMNEILKNVTDRWNPENDEVAPFLTIINRHVDPREALENLLSEIVQRPNNIATQAERAAETRSTAPNTSRTEPRNSVDQAPVIETITMDRAVLGQLLAQSRHDHQRLERIESTLGVLKINQLTGHVINHDAPWTSPLHSTASSGINANNAFQQRQSTTQGGGANARSTIQGHTAIHTEQAQIRQAQMQHTQTQRAQTQQAQTQQARIQEARIQQARIQQAQIQQARIPQAAKPSTDTAIPAILDTQHGGLDPAVLRGHPSCNL